MEERKPMTAAAFFGVDTCLIRPERSAGCIAACDILKADGTPVVKKGEKITPAQQKIVTEEKDRLQGLVKGYVQAVLEIGECSCSNG